MLFLLPRSLADVATDGREARAGAFLAPLEQLHRKKHLAETASRPEKFLAKMIRLGPLLLTSVRQTGSRELPESETKVCPL